MGKSHRSSHEKGGVATTSATSTDNSHDSSPSKTSFRNRGLERWEAARQQWLAHHHHKDPSSPTTTTNNRSAVPLEVDEIIDVIFAPRWRTAGGDDEGPPYFSQEVPLPQMVDVLVDLWEAEGLDT